MQVSVHVVSFTEFAFFRQGAFWGMMIGLVVGLIRFGGEFSYTVPPCGSGKAQVIQNCQTRNASSYLLHSSREQ